MKRLPLVMLAFSLVALTAVAPAAHAASPSKPYIVVLKDAADPTAVAFKQGHAYGFVAKYVYSHALHGYAASLSASALRAIQANPDVLFVAEDGTFTLPGSAQSTQLTSYAVDRIDAPESSTASGDGSGSVNVNVAVLDTGIGPHPDLNVVGGTSCSGHKQDGFLDAGYHGTMVAGSIGAIDNDFGFAGVAPGARLWSVKVVTNDKKGFVSDGAIMCGLDWVTATRTDTDPSNDIAVANMSLGASVHGPVGTCSDTRFPIYRAVCGAVAAGVTVVASAGNETQDLGGIYPATFNEVLAVTGITDLDGLPGGLASPTDDCQAPLNAFSPIVDDSAIFFSNFAALPEDQAHTVAAPAACVASTYPGGLYARASGTSFAAPLVTGTVALCIASGSCAGLSPAQIIQKIVSDAAAYNTANPNYGFSGDPLHNPDPNRYYGFLIRAGLY